eukprot:934206-Amphidinium_carterae.1
MWFCPDAYSTDMLTPVPSVGALPRDTEMEDVLRTVQFHECFRYQFQKVSHINRLEGQAAKAAVKYASKDVSQWGKRLVLLVDSQVVLHVLQRGRSSSYALNQVMRALLPFLIGAHMTVVPLWVHTSRNPADDPTRKMKVRDAETRGIDVEDLLDRAKRDHPVAAFCMSLGVSETVESGQHDVMSFDATMGFPGEGPLPGAGKRECADLKTTVQPMTERRYSLRVHGLELWLESQGHPNLMTLKLQHELLVQMLK